ncbi:MAG: radical SAM protein [Coriobacteriia bacterium]|nr:radical SAM protein [Coriobacteriia bacterium]
MSRVLFVTPPYRCWGQQMIGNWPPLHLVHLAGAAVKAGHDAKIYDAMYKDTSYEEIRHQVETYKPDVVMSLDYLPVTGAISTCTVPAAIEALRVAKQVNPDIHTLLGGPHPTFMYEEILNEENSPIDIVLRGEMEETLADLLGAYADERPLDEVKGIAFVRDGETVATPQRPHIEDLDTLTPAWDLLEWEDYHYNIDPWGRMASILTSRGCMMGCSFCSQRVFWRNEWRARDPYKVMDEIRHLVEEYQVEFITMIDAYPTFDRKRWETILDLLIEADLGVQILIETRVEDIIRDEDILHKYREAGIMHIYVGLETSTDELLSSLNKGTTIDMNEHAVSILKKHDIMIEASFMIGFPEETWDSIKATIAMAEKLNPDIAVFPILTPMPYTSLHTEVYDRIRVWDYSKYNISTPIIEPHDMSLTDITIALSRCYMTFYANKMNEILALPEGFKRSYMLSAMKLMMRDYGEHFDFMGVGKEKIGEVPKKMVEAMKKLTANEKTTGKTANAVAK